MSSSPVVVQTGEETSGIVSTLDLSAFGQCLNGAVEIFTDLELQGFPAERVHIRRNGYLRDDDLLPCAMISHYAIRPANDRGSTRENGVHFLMLLTLHWAGGRDAINGEGLALAALQRSYVAFSKKPDWSRVDADGASCLQVTVDTADALNEEAFRRGIMAKFLIIDCLLRLPYST